MPGAHERLQEAVARFDAANSEDPNTETVDGRERPKELVYAERMTRWLERLEPEASEPLKLAARAQHLRRWVIPRGDYPAGREGYHRWRTTLYRFHAEEAAKILRESGYDDETIERVESLIRKERLKQDLECQTLEDVACLVFLEGYFADFAKQHDEEKLVEIVRKTWRKMSPRGHEAALGLDLPADAQALVGRALGAEST
jgi:hypothetical protein